MMKWKQPVAGAITAGDGSTSITASFPFLCVICG
jgi:hypothetical protein